MRQKRGIINQIKGLSIFDGAMVSTAELQERKAAVLEFNAGERLHGGGVEYRGLGVLLLGTADVMRRSFQGAMFMSRLKKGDLFGAATILAEEGDFAPEIICKSRCRVLFIPEQSWLDWLHGDEALMRNYLRYLNGRLRFLNMRLNALSQNTIENRVLTFLASASVNGAYAVGSFTELAMMLCIGRASLYRALDTLEGQGKLRREGGTIEIIKEKVI
ncbi:MAG: Crp/Fnr family transcriptional regulator [Clostridia bacterium]|nr:Crp/Fnr family transcriptional regulator [Clostridia bacterium]